MEVKREHPRRTDRGAGISRFNPCFDGSEARVSPLALPRKSTCCFNPCFDGSEARVSVVVANALRADVSILVLMEVKREGGRCGLSL